MVFSPVQIYLDHPNWKQQSNPQQESLELPPLQPPPLPSPAQLGGGGTGTIRAGSMVDRARLAKLPLPEAGLKCPRCESTNTKFCYFNNYNLSQPRHFCKTCRRYWTRGGSLRNVPVGGGSRRNSKRNNKASKTSSTSKPISVTNDKHKGCNSNLTEMAFHNFAHQLVGSQSNFMPPFLQNPPQYNGFQTRMEGSSNSSQTDMGIRTSGGNSNSLLLNGGVDHWKLPLFGGLEPPNGLFPYQTDHQGLEEPSLMVRKSQLHPISSTSRVTQLGPMKLEENQRLNILSRQFSGISENYHQQWGGNTWPEISGLNSSSINNFL